MKLNMPFLDFAAVLLRERLVPKPEMVVWMVGMELMVEVSAIDMGGGGGGGGGGNGNGAATGWSV